MTPTDTRALSSFRLSRSVFVLVMLAFSAQAGADPFVCIPTASGVPALSGPPNWWEEALGEPQYWPRLDDPRWRGAFQRTFAGSSVSPHLTFRALRHGSGSDAALYLSWHVQVDPSPDADFDLLHVGLSPGGTADDLIVRITPYHVISSDIEAEPPFAVDTLVRDSATGSFDTASNPDWVNDYTRVWLETPLDDPMPGGSTSWAVEMRVPIQTGFDAGVDLANQFRVWFEVQVKVPDDAACLPDGCIVPYDYPPGESLTDVASASDSSAWQDARRDVATGDASCLSGVTLQTSDVGTVSGAGSCTTSATLSNEIALTSDGSPATNTFCARPVNGMASPIGAGDLSATFRIANWGTQPDWNQVSDPKNLWRKVCGPEATTSNTSAGATATIPCDWTLTNQEVCEFDPSLGVGCANPSPIRRRHQCMLVELGGGGGVEFVNASVYRNMNFVDASVFRREAEVSVVGLPILPAAPPTRDVYLYVQTDNMPPRVQQGGLRGGLGGDAGSIPGRNDDSVDGDRDDGEGPVIEATSPAVIGDDQGGPIQPLPKSPFAELRESLPTYQVHAYHDTGRTLEVDGRTFKVLAPQTSFGYFVRHQGALQGWRHRLEGARKITDNYYKVPVPEDGAETVVTTIEAVERSPWSFSLHGGVNEPDVTGLSRGLSAGIDLEYAFTPSFALELFYGYDEFDGDELRFGDLLFQVPDEVSHLSINAKGYFLSSPYRLVLIGGVGRYDFDPGSTEDGFNVGVGGQFELRPSIDLEATVKRHELDAPSDFTFLTFQVGGRFHF
jgi:hypothetical protein